SILDSSASRFGLEIDWLPQRVQRAEKGMSRLIFSSLFSSQPPLIPAARTLYESGARCLSRSPASIVEKQLQASANHSCQLGVAPTDPKQRWGYAGTAMDEHPFRVLSRKEFDGLSLDEKLAYLDLDLLAAIYGRNKQVTARPSPKNPAAS